MIRTLIPKFGLKLILIYTVRNEGNNGGPSGTMEPNDSLLNHEVGPREWKVYSRRGKRVTKG